MRFLNEYELHRLAVMNYVEFHESAENKAQALYALGILPDFHEIPAQQYANLVHEKLQEQEQSLYSDPTDRFVVLQQNKLRTIEYSLPVGFEEEYVFWELINKNGKKIAGKSRVADGRAVKDFDGRPLQRFMDGHLFVKKAFDIPQERLDELDFDDYRLKIKVPGREDFEAEAVYAPEKCYRIPEAENKKFRGSFATVYGLRSAENLGVGNFSDLAEFSCIMAQNNLDIIGTLPLHALQHTLPESASPYSPISRTFLNFLYLDATAIPEFKQSKEAQNLYYSQEFTEKRRRNQSAKLVDYTTSYQLLLPLLEKVYDTFLNEATEKRKAEFRAFKQQKGLDLQKFALFQVLSEYFMQTEKGLNDWRMWPEEYQNSASPAVRNFANLNRKRVDFFAYLQWETTRQLQNVQHQAKQSGMKIGLYTDLAVGTIPSGFEAWVNKDLYMRGSLGIAPDMCSAEGQDWGIIGYNPINLQKSGFKSFREMLNANMIGGLIRIDCPLCGLYTANLIPENKTPREAFKIYMPTDKMLALIALSSYKNKTPVVFEDLGDIPWHFRAKIEALGGITYKVMPYERGSLRDLPPDTLIVSSTHDSDTQNIAWKGISAYMLENHNCLPAKYVGNYLHDAYKYRQHISGLLRAEQIADFNPNDNANVPVGYYRAVAELMGNNEHCNSTYGIMPVADMLGLPRWRENLPGTPEMHASKSPDVLSVYSGKGNVIPNVNWRLKLPLYLNELAINPRLQEVAAALSSKNTLKEIKFERPGVSEPSIRDPERFVKLYTLLAEKEQWLAMHGKPRFSGEGAYKIWGAEFSTKHKKMLKNKANMQANEYKARVLSQKQNKR